MFTLWPTPVNKTGHALHKLLASSRTEALTGCDSAMMGQAEGTSRKAGGEELGVRLRKAKCTMMKRL